MTIDVGIMFALQLGVGVKGFLDAYVKGTAGLDVIFTISAYTGNSILITAAATVTVTSLIIVMQVIFFITFYKKTQRENRLADGGLNEQDPDNK